jgi:hypothetical protein
MTFSLPSTTPAKDRATGPLARRLPGSCAIRHAVPGDAERVAALLRDADRLEMEALEGRPALAVLQDWMSGGSYVLVMRGDAIAVFGIIPCIDAAVAAEHEAAATPWGAMVSTLGDEDLVDVLWLSRLQVDAWQRRWPVLLTVCDARNRFRGQWLDWLGFERQGRVERFGAAGMPFDLHVRRRGLAPPPAACWTQ